MDDYKAAIEKLRRRIGPHHRRLGLAFGLVLEPPRPFTWRCLDCGAPVSAPSAEG